MSRKKLTDQEISTRMVEWQPQATACSWPSAHHDTQSRACCCQERKQRIPWACCSPACHLLEGVSSYRSCT